MAETGCARLWLPRRENDMPPLVRKRCGVAGSRGGDLAELWTMRERRELSVPLSISDTVGSVALEIVTSAAVTLGEMLVLGRVAMQFPLAHCAIAKAIEPKTAGSLRIADSDRPPREKLHDTPQLHAAGGSGRLERHDGSLACTMVPRAGEHAVPSATSRT